MIVKSSTADEHSATANAHEPPDTPALPSLPPLADDPTFVEAVRAYDVAAAAYHAASHDDAIADDRKAWDAVDNAFFEELSALQSVLSAHAEAVYAVASAASDRADLRQGRAPSVPAYIGHKKHLYRHAEPKIAYYLERAFEQTYEYPVCEILLTIILPNSPADARRVQVTLKPKLPVSHGFLVVHQSEAGFEDQYQANTWEEAAVWLQAHQHEKPVDRTWGIVSLDAEGYYVDTDLLTFAKPPTTEVPPTGDPVASVGLCKLQQILMDKYPIADAATPNRTDATPQSA